MPPRGKRSIRALVKRYIYTVSFRDTKIAETVCTVDRPQLIEWVTANHTVENGLTINDIPCVEKGLVLMDSRGQGVFQK